MPDTQPLSNFSLLWPDQAAPRPALRLDSAAALDLDLHSLIDALSDRYGYAPRIRDTLLALCSDPAVIHYRQDILADLVDHPALAGRLADLLPRLFALDSFVYSARPDQSALHEVVWRIGQLETYVECIQGLSAVFEGQDRTLRAADCSGCAIWPPGSPRMRRLSTWPPALPALVAKVRGIASITVGHQPGPGASPGRSDPARRQQQKSSRVIRPRCCTRCSGARRTKPLGRDRAAAHDHPGQQIRQPTAWDRSARSDAVPLFRDPGGRAQEGQPPVGLALRRYVQVNIQILSGIGAELAFYLGAAALVERLRAAGLPVCLPEIAPLDERVCEIDAVYNVNLALRLLAKGGLRDLSRTVITNDVRFGPEGRIFVLTGPNQGGKTTYTQAWEWCTCWPRRAFMCQEHGHGSAR